MVIRKELLDILVCPENRTPVRQAESELLDGLNAKIAAGTVKNREGQIVTEPLEEALIREDNKVLYPVRDGIPVMLVGESISLEESGG